MCVCVCTHQHTFIVLLFAGMYFLCTQSQCARVCPPALACMFPQLVGGLTLCMTVARMVHLQCVCMWCVRTHTHTLTHFVCVLASVLS